MGKNKKAKITVIGVQFSYTPTLSEHFYYKQRESQAIHVELEVTHLDLWDMKEETAFGEL